jgi:hypothetical protein
MKKTFNNSHEMAILTLTKKTEICIEFQNLIKFSLSLLNILLNSLSYAVKEKTHFYHVNSLSMYKKNILQGRRLYCFASEKNVFKKIVKISISLIKLPYQEQRNLFSLLILVKLDWGTNYMNSYN